MALVVEDGTGLSTAESYLSADDLRERTVRLGLGYLANPEASSDDAVEGALRRATSVIDSLYGASFVGLPRRIDQALCWPRVQARPSGLGVGFLMPPVGALAAAHGYYAVGNRLHGRPGGVGVVPTPTAYLPPDGLPRALLDALAHATVREIAAPGSLAPDEYAGVVTREQVGPLSVTYEGARGTGGGIPRVIETMLRPLRANGAGSVVHYARS